MKHTPFLELVPPISNYNEFSFVIGPYTLPFLIGTKYLPSLGNHLRKLNADKFFIVSDARVGKLYGETLTEIIPNAVMFTHEEGEQGKTSRSLHHLIDSILQAGATRRSCIVGLGGGVTGNITGLVAALLFRGIRLVHIPTSLMAMSDSVLSLKQAVNGPTGKNVIGTFHPATLTCIDTTFLDTLSETHVRSGLCETIKNILAISPHELPWLSDLLEKTLPHQPSVAQELILRSLRAKQAVMQNDAHERKAGIAFEYGHTVGHAVEFLLKGQLSHGDCVAFGMLVAAEVSYSLGFLSRDNRDLHFRLVKKAGCPMPSSNAVTPEAVLDLVMNDNKRGYLQANEKTVPMVLLQELGEPILSDNLPLILAPTTVLHAALSDVLSNQELLVVGG